MISLILLILRKVKYGNYLFYFAHHVVVQHHPCHRCEEKVPSTRRIKTSTMMPMDYTTQIPDQYDLYIFDLDGTLIDSLDDLTTAMNATLAHNGFPAVDRETVRRGIGNGARTLVSRTLATAANVSETELVSLVERTLPEYRAEYAKHCTENRPVSWNAGMAGNPETAGKAPCRPYQQTLRPRDPHPEGTRCRQFFHLYLRSRIRRNAQTRSRGNHAHHGKNRKHAGPDHPHR